MKKKQYLSYVLLYLLSLALGSKFSPIFSMSGQVDVFAVLSVRAHPL